MPDVKKKRKPNWIKIRIEYETINISYRKLAEKYGVSENTIESRARREQWKKGKQEITEKITEKTREKTVEKISENNTITKDKILEELANIAFSDIKNFLSYKTEKTVVGHDELGKPIIDYKTVIDLKDSDKVDTRSISEVSQGKDGVFKFKTYCKDHALDKLARYLNLYAEIEKEKLALEREKFEFEKQKQNNNETGTLVQIVDNIPDEGDGYD
jgi:hypothetical protein